MSVTILTIDKISYPAGLDTSIYRVLQKELYNFESL
jgi:hypothetical protein